MHPNKDPVIDDTSNSDGTGAPIADGAKQREACGHL